MSINSPNLATPVEIASAVKRTGATTVNDQLVELAELFKQAAMLIDPTIKGIWAGYDMVCRPDGILNHVYLERESDPFVRKSANKMGSRSNG